jgi:hypothetical protein
VATILAELMSRLDSTATHGGLMPALALLVQSARPKP